MENTFDVTCLDVQTFAQNGAQLSGQRALHTWPRLQAEQWPVGTAEHAEPEMVRWQLRGQLHNAPAGETQVSLHLDAQTQIVLQCQRCLGSLTHPLHVQQHYVFVADEATAAALDETSDDDILALSQELDAQALIEDELLLALPLVACHDICPTPLPSHNSSAADLPVPDAKPHPFAALAALKKNNLRPD